MARGLGSLPPDFSKYFVEFIGDFEDVSFDYVVDRSDRVLYAKAKAEVSQFNELASFFSFRTLRYDKGFHLDSESPFSEFNPVGDRVFVSKGKPEVDSRRIISIYFEPVGATGDDISIGNLYIHIE